MTIISDERLLSLLIVLTMFSPPLRPATKGLVFSPFLIVFLGVYV